MSQRGKHPASLAALAKAREKKRDKTKTSRPHLARFHTPEHMKMMTGAARAKKQTEAPSAVPPAPEAEPPRQWDILHRSTEGFIKPEPEPTPTPEAPKPEPKTEPPLTPHMAAVRAGKIPWHPPEPSLTSPWCAWCWQDWQAAHATESEGDRRARLAVERRFLSNARDVEDSWERGAPSRPGPSPQFKSLCAGLL